jgi:hypothetical protein
VSPFETREILETLKPSEIRQNLRLGGLAAVIDGFEGLFPVNDKGNSVAVQDFDRK